MIVPVLYLLAVFTILLQLIHHSNEYMTDLQGEEKIRLSLLANLQNYCSTRVKFAMENLKGSPNIKVGVT